MATIICFKCKKPMDESASVCPRCQLGSTQPDADPAVVVMEKAFLLEQAIELSSLPDPTFMGFNPDLLTLMASRVPPLPLTEATIEVWRDEPKEKLLAKLDDGTPWERAMAAIQLAAVKEGDVTVALLRHLTDKDKLVRRAILWALGRICNSMALAPLIEYGRMEKDKQVRQQLAACMYNILAKEPSTRTTQPSPMTSPEVEGERPPAVSDDPSFRLELGKFHVRRGKILQAIGDYSRTVDQDGRIRPEALFYRSQAFLLLGKPLFSLDDMVECPLDHDYPAVFHLHKAALLMLGKQIASAARNKGLESYARMFEKRIEKITDH